MVGNNTVWACAVVFATMFLAAHAEDFGVVEQMPPVKAAPQELLCSSPQERGMQYIACDAFKKLGEPVSPVTELGRTNLAIRITYVPSFSPWSVIRVEFAPREIQDGKNLGLRAAVSVATENGSGRRYVRSFELDWDEMWLILKSVDLDAVSAMPNTNESKKITCLDGTDYIVENAQQSRYHWVLLGCNDPDDPRQSLHSLTKLLAVIARAHDSEGLKDFPGH